jgi:hypothetical protein
MTPTAMDRALAGALWDDATAARGALTVAMQPGAMALDWSDAEPAPCERCNQVWCICSERVAS